MIGLIIGVAALFIVIIILTIVFSLKIRPRVGFDQNSGKVIKCRKAVSRCQCFKKCPKSYS